ncbi:cation diffusion facilitator family transporter [Bacteriovorax sp. Seq25_V]|uniref:cation diffusion facilitator family transporter n=1 Tax=Bacteriovorax sp. Seq25_V TaxID=1201288 RepID=UPI00038A4420|nr:cation diffusion facilitator family transporter [Bacteriovorax sp. Seq25_V]EQC46213.1 cation diffusion facilitator family transporter [Bacteriovorax sp. Seq25_V]
MTLNLREKQIKKVLYITMGLNLLSALIKIVAGSTFHYLSLSSSGLESVFDGFGNVVALIAITYASMPGDKNHNYGHYKFENLGSLFLSVLLFSSAVSLFLTHKDNLLSGNPAPREFGIVPIVSILVSMGISYFVATYEKREGERLNSRLLTADGEHTLGDFILSFGVLISIITSKFGMVLPDIIIGFLIIIYLIYLAIKIARGNLNDLLDHSPDIEKQFIEEIEGLPQIMDVHKFRARGNSHWMHIDFHLLVDPSLSLIEAHALSHQAEDLLRKRLASYCHNIDITIHVEPYEKNHMD